MHLIRVGGSALNQTPLDWDRNRDRILAAVQAARDRGIAVLCLPELCISGYGCEDAFQSPGVQQMAWRVLLEIEPHTAGLVVAVGLPVRFESGVYDAAAVLADGRLAGLACKQHLAGEGIHYEPRWFRSWPKGRRAQLTVDGRSVPIGDLRFDCGGIRIGFEICEDAWAADRPGASLAARGVDVILNPSASHFAFGKDEIRRRFVQEGSRAFGATYVYANLLGNEAGRAIYDGGVIIATAGRIVAAGRRFSWTDEACTAAIVDVDATRLVQARLSQESVPATADSPGDCECVSIPFTPPVLSPQRELTAGDARDAWETGPHVKDEEFARAVALGLFDYLRKSRARGFVVSASGGADSSAVACLVALAVRFAARDMPVAAVTARLGLALPPSDAVVGGDEASIRRLIHAVLICVYQSTAHSGDVTSGAARSLAESLGAEFHEFDVERIVQGYRALVVQALGRPLDWQTDDIALQNIQARARSPSVWMLANIRGALLVSTSNRSEAAVGYATMDGDTSGGIAPIAGIDKASLRRWLVWLEHAGPDGIGSFPALSAVNVQAPTAELRPPADHQTDEADLMPYDVLDAAERCAIRDKQTPLETWQWLRVAFPGHGSHQLALWTERFFTLWSCNQWKRERYAPSFHLDDESLDPKTWCRFPILSGGFSRELAELRAAARSSVSGGVG
ncbi:MAG: NAD(+) synthase [Planctomycetes bacterium]|nr:NAD(+) synthase [Planctomycetota bacterium]